MKKGIIIGLIIGLAASFSFTALAEEISNLIGKPVEGEFSVTIDGKTLEEPAIVVEGRTYPPLRAIAEEIGYDVNVNNEEKRVDLTMPKTVTEDVYTDPSTNPNIGINAPEIEIPDPREISNTMTLDQIERRIHRAKRDIFINSQAILLSGNPDGEYITKLKVVVQQFKDELAELEALKAELEAAQPAE